MIKIWSTIFLFFLLSSADLFGQDADTPILNCVDVVNGDDVRIHWTKPEAEPANFSHYEIAFSITNINFPNVHEIFDYNTEEFYDGIGTADNGPIYYFIRTVYTNLDVSASSDTLSTMFLNLNGQSFTAPLAEMNWNPLFSPSALDTSEGTYFIQQNYGAGWMPTGMTNFGDENYSELINVCHGDDDSVLVSYRVQIPNPAGCVSTSLERTGKYQDVNPPSLPEIETVTVDTVSQNSVICWYPSAEGDTQGYIVQEVVITGLDTNYFTIGQTSIPSELSYEHLSSVANTEIENFVIIPFDSCLHSGNSIGNTNGNINSSYMAGTMLLNSELDQCERKVTLNWNQYVHWDEGVLGYEILASENGAPFQLVGTRGPNGNEFSISNLTIDANYCFLVKALSNGLQKPSFSSKACILIEYPERPDFAYLSQVTVLGDRAIELTAFHSGGLGMKYQFEKFDSNFNDYFPIGTVNYDPLMGPDVVYIDNLNAPVNSAERYRVSLIDSCGVNYVNSQDGRNINLRVAANSDNGENTLVWNKYPNWDGAVLGYEIYRGNRGEDLVNFNLITTLPSWRTDYTDDVNAFIDIQGEFCYHVRALENLNSYGLAKASLSNQDCASQKPIFWIPNAIVMGGVNTEFKPVGGFLNIENYSLVIFNRWGQEIFESKDFEIGWKGFYKGEAVQQGVYFYYIRYQGGDGEVFEQRGDVYFFNSL